MTHKPEISNPIKADGSTTEESKIMIQAELMSPPETLKVKWLNSPVKRYEGKLSEIHQYIPDFERREFILPVAAGESRRTNVHLDTIVRRPFGDDHTFVPIGTISKNTHW